MAIDQIKQSIDSQINSVVSSSPVATPPVVEDIKVVVPAEVSSVSQEGSVAGGEYGAVRRDSFSPSTQLSTGVKLSSDPRDVYSGGIVEAGRNVYADLPDSSDDFYLRVKYAPVKQYPLRMPDGNMYDVTTSDFRKAMWQFYMDKMGVPADADWFGYYYVPEQVRETFVGSMLRAIPNTATALGSDLASVALRAPANALEALGIAPETSAAYDEIIKDIFDNVKDTLHVGDVTEETANKYGSMTGSALFTVGAAILSGGSSVAVNTLAAAEAASAYNGIYDSLKNAGYSPASAFAMSVGGGLGVGLLSKAGSVGEKAMQASAGAGRGLVYAALKNPGELSRMARRYVPYNALAEAITEPLQSELENFMSSGMSVDSLGENFDERLFEFFSALAIGAGAAYYNSTKMPAYEDRIRSYASDMRRTLEQIQKALPYSSKGIITDEVLADLITVVNKPEFGRVAYEMMRESIYGQFDKVPKTERAKLMKTLSKLDSVAALEKEYTIFEERLDKLFVNSGLDTNVEAELRLLLRAVASWNLAKRGILPSKAPLPQKISIEPTRVVKNLDEDVAAGVAGHTLGDVIFLNPAVPSSPMVEQNIGKGLGTEPVNMAKSRSVMSEAARSAKGNPNVDQGRSAKVAYARHEVTHWIAENSGLKDVPRFMNALKRIANTVVPQFTKGKTGTELAEAYAVGMQYASEQAAKEVGLQGPVGEYIDFMHTMLYAQERAQGLQKDVQAYVETLRAVMAQNKEFVDELIKGFGSEKLRGAIKEFIKTGDSSLLDAETIKGLNTVLQSVADAQTQDNLETIFGSPNQMRDFSKQVAGIRSKANRQAAIEKADKRDQLRAEANVQVGLPENTKPTAAPTMSEAASEIATEDVELPKAETKTETEPGVEEGNSGSKPTPRKRTQKDNEDMDVDRMDYKMMGDEELLNYVKHVSRWLRLEKTTPAGEELWVSPRQYIGWWERTPDQVESQIKAVEGYVSRSMAQVRERGLSKRPEVRQALKNYGVDEGLYAVIEPNILKVDKLIDTLLDIPAEERTPAEQELYRAVAIYDTKSSEFVQGEFPDMSIYEINVELIKLAQDLDEALFQISAEPKSRVFGQINSLKKRLEGHIQFLEDNNHDIIMHDMLVADGILEPDYAGTTDDRTRAQKQYDKEMAAVEDLYKRAKKLEKSKSEADQYTALELKGKAERIRQGAERRLEIAKKAPRRSLGRLSHYFTPKYDSDFSSRMIGVQTVDSAYAFLKSGQGTEEQRAVAQKVVEQNRTLASYVNPARTVGKRPLLDTPSPLEEMGISVEEALQKIASAGLKPYEISESILGDTEEERNIFIGKSYNLEESAPLTRSRIYAKLIDFMLHEDFGMKNIAESGDDAQMMRVLLAIHEAKYLANDMFARYLGREQSFDKNPSNNPITEAAVNEMKKERGKAQLKDHMQNLGYSEVALVHDLFVGDEVAYMGGNNFFRGIVSFKGRTPSGAMFYVIRKDVDVANQKSKKSPVSGMEERVVSASDLGRVGVVRKPASTQDAAHVKEVFDFYDEAYAAAGRNNITKLAILSVQEAEGGIDIYDAIDPIKREIAEELSSLGSPNVGLFAAAPTIDPGVFAVIGGSMEDTLATYERAIELDEEYANSGIWYEGKSEQDAIVAAEMARREDMMKPKLFDAVTKKNENGISFLNQLEMLEQGLEETRVNKALYFLGSGSGTDRKGRLLFGKVWDKAFGLSKAYSYAQQRRESLVHKFDEEVINYVFKGNRRAYDKWRAEIKAEKFDATVNGVAVKISRGEIMSLYAIKKQAERSRSASNQLARLRDYQGIDGLIENLTAEDKAFAEILALNTINSVREGITSVPTDWVPAVEMTTYMRDGWASRKKTKPNNERGFVDSEVSLAALDLYDSVISSISRFATHASGLMVQLDNLKQILAFTGVDKSVYREFDKQDQDVYDDLLQRSVRLREAIAKKIGNTQAKWLLQGIEYDLVADPLADDIGTAPGMEWFQRLTRGAAASALSLNLRQAVQNLGNYHRFFGLSSSSGIKFYTADWVNAVAHIKEAWALAMENPEFKRRFEQAGLSEHMRRIADVSQSSFLTDIQTKLFEKGKDGASDVVGTLNSLSSIGTKWGLATNVLPDMVGIALGNYAVWNDVLAKNGGNANAAQREIADFVNNRVSSSNYMTQSLLKKRLNKMGLGALVMFQSDQLQSFGALAEAWSTLMNSQDAGERSMAKKDIASFVVSMGRYIAIKAGWVGAVMATAMGRDLSDDEWKYIYDSTAYEMVAQLGGWSQFNNIGISPFIRSLMEGENFGPSVVTVSAMGRLISDVRKGAKGDAMSFVDALGETLALSGIAPAFPGALRIFDGIYKIASGNEYEQAVGWKQVTGTTETGAIKQLGLSKSKKTGEIRPKKKLKKDGE